MKICTCGHTLPDHNGWSGQGSCHPWLKDEKTGKVYVGACDCKAGDYRPENKPAKGARV